MTAAVQSAATTYTVYNRTTGQVVATQVAIAGVSRDRRKGLSKHTALADGEGLWIAPCEAIHTFGMKMPIDAIFLSRDFRVQTVRHRLNASRIAFCLRAYSVLEVAANAASAALTAPGHLFEFLPNQVEVP